MHKAIIVLINCNTPKEAEKIGKRLLKERLVACIDIVPRSKTIYYWPPGKNKLKNGRGCTLTAVTFNKHLHHIEYITEKFHSDKTPFIGAIDLTHISKEYFNWLSLELK